MLFNGCFQGAGDPGTPGTVEVRDYTCWCFSVAGGAALHQHTFFGVRAQILFIRITGKSEGNKRELHELIFNLWTFWPVSSIHSRGDFISILTQGNDLMDTGIYSQKHCMSDVPLTRLSVSNPTWGRNFLGQVPLETTETFTRIHRKSVGSETLKPDVILNKQKYLCE